MDGITTTVDDLNPDTRELVAIMREVTDEGRAALLEGARHILEVNPKIVEFEEVKRERNLRMSLEKRGKRP